MPQLKAEKQSAHHNHNVSDKELSISKMVMEHTHILSNESTALTCVVEGKPIIEADKITWYHENPEVDLSSNVKTMKGSNEYIVTSILTLDEPSVKYSGKFTCFVNGTLRKTTEVVIAGTEDLQLLKQRSVKFITQAEWFMSLVLFRKMPET